MDDADDTVERRRDLVERIGHLERSMDRAIGEMSTEIRLELERMRTEVTRQIADSQQVSALLAGTQDRMARDFVSMGHRIDALERRVDANEKRQDEQKARTDLVLGVTKWLGPIGTVAVLAALYQLMEASP